MIQSHISEEEPFLVLAVATQMESSLVLGFLVDTKKWALAAKKANSFLGLC